MVISDFFLLCVNRASTYDGNFENWLLETSSKAVGTD